MNDIYECKTPSLPADKLKEAAERAVEINPDNDPARRLPGRMLALVDDPGLLAVYTGKRWGPKVDLGVTFLETTSAELKAKILAYANKWGQYADIRFRESSQGEIRLSRGSGGYYSYLGTDCLSIPRGEQTMNLQGFSLNTPDSEYDRVVVHEFGHAVGCPHEHARKAIIDLLDKEATIAEFMRTQGWSRNTVIAQILTPINEASVMGNSEDVHSIMCYSFSGRCTKSGEPIPGGKNITEHDAELIGKAYPKAVSPPPPPPPTGDKNLMVGVAVSQMVAALKGDGYTVTKGTADDIERFVLNRMDALGSSATREEIIALILQIIQAWLKSRG